MEAQKIICMVLTINTWCLTKTVPCFIQYEFIVVNGQTMTSAVHDVMQQQY